METAHAADLVQREAAALAALLEAPALPAAVPGCPGWRLVDLARHTGGVHRWAAAALGTPPDGSAGPEPEGPSGDDAVRPWFEEGAAALAAALRATSADTPCWTFASHEAPATAAFWARRQVLETALHRWDAETAVAAGGLGATPDPTAWLDDDVATAGVAEVTGVLTPRQVRLGRTPPLPGVLALQSPSGRCLLGDEGAAEPVAELSGPAAALLLLLWRRTTLERELAAGRLVLAGSRDAADRLLSGALTP